MLRSFFGMGLVAVLVSCGSETTNSQGNGGVSGSNGTAGKSSSGAGGASNGSDSGPGGALTMGDAASSSDAMRPSGGCSEMPIRTGPLPGKESFTVTTPADEHFPFTKHWVGVFSDDPRYVSMASLTDIDNDGDLDFACGQREDVGGGMNWFEYCGPDHWVRHHVGEGHKSAAGGGAMDVDGDGWVDLIASDSWYKNPKTPRAAGNWQRYLIKNLRVEEVIIGDVNNDKKPDALFLMTGIEPQWWTPGADPTQQWTIGKEIGTTQGQMQRQGGAIGDIDGDGKNDVLAGHMWWYRNVNGDGMTWEAHQFAQPDDFTDEPLTYLGDLDNDGDTDFAMVTHWGGDTGADVAWYENRDGKGLNMVKHMLATGKGWLHDVVIADFDNDGDNDIFVGKNTGPQWIWENDGKGNFTEHTIATDWRGHEARVGDVDCDGDLDIVGKPWGDPNEGGEGAMPPRDVVYLQNMLVERGGKPMTDWPKWLTFQKQPPYTCKR
jgi:hypothetical protein